MAFYAFYSTQISLGGLENVLWWCKNSWRCTSLPPVSLFFHDTSFSKARKLMILHLLNFGKSYKHLPNNYATWYAINSLARADYTGPYCMAKYIFFVEECYQVSYRFIKIFRTLSMSATFQAFRHLTLSTNCGDAKTLRSLIKYFMKSSCVTSLIESVPSILGKKSFLFTRRVKLSIFWTVRVHINSLIVKGLELLWSVKWGCKMALVSDKRDVDNWTFVWNKRILIYFMFQLSSGHICNYITAEYLHHAMQYIGPFLAQVA